MAPVTGTPDRLLRRLEWQVVRRLDGQVQGGYRTVFRGAGIDFADLREYTPEDDVRHIDWNVTARMDEPFVRQYTQDRELTAWLVLDRSASMRFGAGGQGEGTGGHGEGAGGHGKDRLLTELAVSLGRLFTGSGNRVGAILYDNAAQRVIPPRTGRTHLLHITDQLTRPPTGRPDRRPTDLAAMLRLAARTARRRSLVLVISDFIGDGRLGAGADPVGPAARGGRHPDRRPGRAGPARHRAGAGGGRGDRRAAARRHR